MKSTIKKLIPRNTVFFDIVLRVYNYWVPPISDAKAILKSYDLLNENIKFIQVGSNDGVKGDPLFQFVCSSNWSGILIEPVQYIFNELVSNYPSELNLIFENIAIDNEKGEKPFYRLKRTTDETIVDWYDEVGSLKKDVVLKHKKFIPELDSLMMEEQVKTDRLDSLVEKHKFYDVNIIHIDTEGYDFEVLKMIPFEVLNSLSIILFEHKHLSRSDFKKCIFFLRKRGFIVRKDAGESDTIAIKKEVMNTLKDEK